MAKDPKQASQAFRLPDEESASMEKALFDAITRLGDSGPATKDETMTDSHAARDPMSEPLAGAAVPESPAAAANDDRPSVGRVLSEVQGRLPRTSYMLATAFAVIWAICGVLLARIFYPDLQALAGVGPAATPALIGLAAVIFLPILFFYVLAHMMWRSQELRVIAQSMATMAMRFSEPETTAREALTTIGQAIRRDVAIMSEGVERALARASELESLMNKEVASLERASNASEARMRSLLDDLAHHRENLVGQTEKLREVVAAGVSYSDKAVDTMRSTIELFDTSVGAKTDEVTASLDERLQRFREALDNGTQSLETTLHSRVLEIARTLSDSGKEIVAALEQRAEDARGMIAGQGAEFVETVGQKLVEIESKLGERAVDLTKDLDQRVSIFEQIAIERSQVVAEQIASHSMRAIEALDSHIEHVSQSLKANSDAAAAALEDNTRATGEIINSRMGELAQSIRSAASEAADHLAAQANAATGSLAARSEELALSIRNAVGEAAGTLTTQANAASEILTGRSAELAETIRSNADSAVDRLVSNTTSLTEALNARVDELTSMIERRTGDSERSLARVSEEVENRLTKLSTGIATVLKQNAGEVETSMLGVSTEVVRNFVAKTDELAEALNARAAEMTEILDEKSGRLITILSEKGTSITEDVARVTGEAVRAIEEQGLSFVQNVKDNSDSIARIINEASGNAADSLSKTIKEMQETTAFSIEASKKAATESLTEFRESQDMLRSESGNVFERLREANILLQEIVSGAHESMGTLETTLSARLQEFVAAMTEVTERSGAATDRMTGHINAFQGATSKVLLDLTNLADQVESHGNVLVQAVDLIDKINQRTVDAVNERRAALDALIATLDLKTDDLEQRLRRFSGLLDNSLESAMGRAREIGRLIAESSVEGARTISEQFEVVRDTTEKERRLTVEAMQGIYEQAMGDTHTLFHQTTERFSELLRGVKEMSAEMQRELDATRAELRRGVLELPQETAESAAQMRRVIVDQIEALAELNRFVARHARGQDNERRAAEPALAVVGGARAVESPRPAAARPAERSEAYGPQRPQRPAAPAQGPAPTTAASRSAWLTDLLQRTSRPGESARSEERPAATESRAAHTIESLDALSADISRLVDHEAVADMWDRYNRGERNVFSRRLYTPQGVAAFDELRKRYRTEGEFRQMIDHYIAEFERLLNEVSRGDRGQVVVRTYLTSETGKVYTLLAHAAGRFD